MPVRAEEMKRTQRGRRRVVGLFACYLNPQRRISESPGHHPISQVTGGSSQFISPTANAPGPFFHNVYVSRRATGYAPQAWGKLARKK
jgi:hypothetical protein